jgi:hypothetical protein
MVGKRAATRVPVVAASVSTKITAVASGSLSPIRRSKVGTVGASVSASIAGPIGHESGLLTVKLVILQVLVGIAFDKVSAGSGAVPCGV